MGEIKTLSKTLKTCLRSSWVSFSASLFTISSTNSWKWTKISTSEKSLPDRPMLRVGQILQHKFAKKIVGRQVCHWQHYWGKGNKNFVVHCALYKCIGCCIYIIIIMVQCMGCWLLCASQGEDHSKVKFNLIHRKYKDFIIKSEHQSLF